MIFDHVTEIQKKKIITLYPGLGCRVCERTPQLPPSIGEHVTFVTYFAETTTSFHPAAVLPPLTFAGVPMRRAKVTRLYKSALSIIRLCYD